MELICENLYLGNASDAKNLPNLIAHDINVVFNVAVDLHYQVAHKYNEHRELVQQKIGMTDGMNNPPELFVAAVLALKGLMDRGNKILIHCHQGRSRSPCVVAAYLSIKEGKDFLTKLEELKSIRAIVNPEPGMIQYAQNSMPKIQEYMYLLDEEGPEPPLF
jgi:protein-tyrosine phosphatase